MTTAVVEPLKLELASGRKWGLFSRLRRRHFTEALSLASRWAVLARRAADLSCGDGAFLDKLVEHYTRVYGIERSEEALRLAGIVAARINKRDGIDRCHVTNNLWSFRRASWRFDVMFCLDVLAHLDREGREQLLNDIQDTIARLGVVIVSVPDMTGWRFLLRRLAPWLTPARREPLTRMEFLCHFYGDVPSCAWHGGNVGFDWRELRREFVQNGFTILQEKRVHLRVYFALEGRQ